MNQRILLIICASMLFLFSCNKKNEPAKVSLDWIVNPNVQANKMYQHQIRLINEDDAKTLDKNWEVYFCIFPRDFILPENSPVNISKVKGSLYKITPTEVFSPLASHDTLIINYELKDPYAGISHTPDGAYIVENANNSFQAKDVEVKLFRDDAVYNALDTLGNTIYYPFGDKVYKDNLNYNISNDLTSSDFIPTAKKTISKDEKPFNFDKNISIVSPDQFSNEKKLLTDKLSTLYACQLNNNGTTKIVLKEIDASELPNNKEAYKLSINSDSITIEAATTHGMFNGTQTLLSLLGPNALPVQLNAQEIIDYPDMDYRGMMIDVSRNFTSQKDLLKIIDLLSMYKMNALHLHLVDDEGWRLEIRGIEELTTVGAKRGHTTDESDHLLPAYVAEWNANNTESSANGYYTREDFIEILKYAKDRHIEIIPEIEFPGHARASIVAMKARYNNYKDKDLAKAEEFLLSEDDDTSVYVSVQGYDDNVVSVARESTYHFIDKVFSEIKSMYEDAGVKLDIIHIGGDEVPEGAWTQSPMSKKIMQEQSMTEARELKDYFIEKVLKIAKDKDIRIAGWQEIVLKPHASDVDSRFEDDKVISYCWNTIEENRLEEVPYRLANANFDVILCNVANLYVDHAYDANFFERGLSWGGFIDERSSFDLQPYNLYQSIRRDKKGQRTRLDPRASVGKTTLNENNKSNILGIQGELFSETIRNFDNVSTALLPKMYGIVERGWNADADWMNSRSESKYYSAANKYNNIVYQKELPRAKQMGLPFHIPAPGIEIIDGKLYANSRVPNATIKYTLDGSEPRINSTEWTEAISCNEKTIKAKAFYLDQESVTSVYQNK